MGMYTANITWINSSSDVPTRAINRDKVHDQEVEHLQAAWLMDEEADLHYKIDHY